MIEFKTNLKTRILTEYSENAQNIKSNFSTVYSASLNQNIINRKMRTSGSKFPSRFIDRNKEKDE